MHCSAVISMSWINVYNLKSTFKVMHVKQVCISSFHYLTSCDWTLDLNLRMFLLTITFYICFNCVTFPQIWVNKITSVTRKVTNGILNFKAYSTMRSFSHSLHSTTGCMQGNTKTVDHSEVVCGVRTDKSEPKNSHWDSCTFNDLMMAHKC